MQYFKQVGNGSGRFCEWNTGSVMDVQFSIIYLEDSAWFGFSMHFTQGYWARSVHKTWHCLTSTALPLCMRVCVRGGGGNIGLIGFKEFWVNAWGSPKVTVWYWPEPTLNETSAERRQVWGGINHQFARIKRNCRDQTEIFLFISATENVSTPKKFVSYL